MNTPPDGGPAFPSADHWYNAATKKHEPVGDPGMSLRDWFAGQALAAIPHIGCGCDLSTSEAAAAAYQFADAMINARGA